jgi:hypothetical protein
MAVCAFVDIRGCRGGRTVNARAIFASRLAVKAGLAMALFVQRVTTMETPANPPLKQAPLHRLGVYATVILLAFLVGFVPMWLRARTRTIELDAAQLSLRLAQTENTLASAAILARRGDYEPAREAASTFYTSLRAELDGQGVSTTQRDMLQPLLAQRDQMITLLARSDPAVAERLADAYVVYRRAMGTSPSGGAGQ